MIENLKINDKENLLLGYHKFNFYAEMFGRLFMGFLFLQLYNTKPMEFQKIFFFLIFYSITKIIVNCFYYVFATKNTLKTSFAYEILYYISLLILFYGCIQTLNGFMIYSDLPLYAIPYIAVCLFRFTIA